LRLINSDSEKYKKTMKLIKIKPLISKLPNHLCTGSLNHYEKLWDKEINNGNDKWGTYWL